MWKNSTCILIVLLLFSLGCQGGSTPQSLRDDIEGMKLMLENDDRNGLIKNYGWDYHEYVLSIGESDEVLNNMSNKIDDNLIIYINSILASKPYAYNDDDPESYEFRVEGELVMNMPIYFLRYKGEETWKIMFP